MTVAGDALVAEARRWVGTRWQHQGRSRLGCDCIGLIGGVCASTGLTDDWLTDASLEFNGYGRAPLVEWIARGCARWMNPVEWIDRQLGDVIVLNFRGLPGAGPNPPPQHFAFLSGVNPDYMIHSYASARRVAENGIDRVWRSRVVSLWRLKGVG
ncbi:MAG TPA: hypothetical protein VMS04_15650 [Vicinamibacterales bacterium]|jgi:hypothetical protein|nr:hypothetical protein [Vicinamibacterales bacterium]